MSFFPPKTKNEKSRDILIIVDMQSFFDTSYSVLGNVIKRIEQAIKNGERIFILEYKGCGPSHKEINRLLSQHKGNLVHRIKKDDDSGGQQICHEVIKYHLCPNKIEICGVNFDACIQSTICDMIVPFSHLSISILGKCVSSEDTKEMTEEERLKKVIRYFRYRFARSKKVKVLK